MSDPKLSGTMIMDPDARASATSAPVADQPAAPTTLPVPPAEGAASAVGHLIAGKYKLAQLLGEGGMGAVYEGEHIELGKRIAVKLVHAEHTKHAEVAERFKREARAASAVDSDHIVQVFDVGVDPRLGLFMVMEFLRGRDLAVVLEAGALEPMVACGVVAQAAAGLEAAHAAGIVHRDLKPANIFLVPRGDASTLVKLVDFGIAKVVSDASQTTASGLTRVGSALGTPQYMSPEQAQGLPDVDLRTDVFALGLVLFEAITGQAAYPMKATYEQMIIQLITTPTPRASALVPGLSPALDQLIFEMMARAPEARPASMSVVLDRLLALYPRLAETKLVVPGFEADAARASRGRSTGAFGAVPVSRTSGRVTTGAHTPGGVALGGAAAPTSDDELDAPPPKSGAGRAVAFAVLGLAAVASIAIAFVKLTRDAPSTESAPAVAAAPSATPPRAPEAPASAAPVVVTPVASASSSARVAAAAATARPVSGARVAPPPPAAGGPAPPPKPGGGAKVGGAGVSDKF